MIDATFHHLSEQPLKPLNDRVWRLYSGGKCLDQWLGQQPAIDGEYPEMWVASTIKAKNAGREHIAEGLSRVELDDGTINTLKDVIDSDPVAFLGRKHAEIYGGNPAVLVKLLDSAVRLTIQSHPDREFALENFQSQFGKTESWYVLGGRSIDEQSPYVLLGFKPEVTKDRWRQLFDQQDIQGMIESLHKIPIQEGDVFLVEAGVPHAIGGGCFLIEVQEPTDYTFRMEKTSPGGKPLSDAACHLGLGFDRMMDSFHFQGFTYDETIANWKKQPKIIREEAGGKEVKIIGIGDTDRFQILRLDVSTELTYRKRDTFCIAIVIEGNGNLVWEGGQLEAETSDQLFLPAGIEAISWINGAIGDFKILLCFGPDSLNPDGTVRDR